jgi:hypothetical protein
MKTQSTLFTSSLSATSTVFFHFDTNDRAVWYQADPITKGARHLVHVFVEPDFDQGCERSFLLANEWWAEFLVAFVKGFYEKLTGTNL